MIGKISGIFLLASLVGCATQVTPEMLAKAEKHKGEKLIVSTSLVASDRFETVCGYAKPNESVHCSQDILRRKLVVQAKEACVFFTMGPIEWQGTYAALYNRSTFAEAMVTCLGPKT